MGFDIYGLNPRQHKEKPEILNKSFMDITDKDEQSEYFEAKK